MLVASKELLQQAQGEKRAVPQFNVWSCAMLFGVLDALEQTQTPAILASGLAFLQRRELELFSTMLLSAARKTNLPLSVHWDHAKHPSELAAARELGYTSVMIDGSSLPLADNITLTKQGREVLRGSAISLEGELGYVGAEHGEVLTDYRCTQPADALRYCRETGVDALAVAIGNAHGSYHAPPKLRLDTLEELHTAVSVPLVLHGGSGIGDEALRAAIRGGIAKINFHTELCQAAMEPQGETGYRNLFARQRAAITNKTLSLLRRITCDD